MLAEPLQLLHLAVACAVAHQETHALLVAHLPLHEQRAGLLHDRAVCLLSSRYALKLRLVLMAETQKSSHVGCI